LLANATHNLKVVGSNLDSFNVHHGKPCLLTILVKFKHKEK
jgi:hypothetical protein